MSGLSWYNIAICLIVSWGGYAYGFGFASFITSQGQPSFYVYLNLDPTSSYTANILGACNALFNFGLAIGSLFQGWLCDVVGRKKAFAVAGACSLIGAALITGSVTIEMLIVVRLLHGFGLGMLICLVPLYLTEVAPPKTRGLLSGLTTASFGAGYLVCAWVAVGTYHGKTFNVQVRLPWALAMVGPAALLLGLPFIPESPRYLVFKNRNPEAWKVLQRIHRDPHDGDDSMAHAEYTQIVLQIEKDKEVKAGYMEMFKNPSWRRRALLAIFIQFAAQSTGILGIANYLVLIFTSLGMSGVMPLVVYAVYTTVGIICVLIAISTVDKVGRRTMFLIGFPSLAVILLIEGILQWQYLGTNNNPGLAGCVFVIFVYIVVFQTVDGPSFIWMAEIFPTNIRGRGIGLGFFSYFVGAITYSTPSNLAFKNIKYRMYFIYMGLCLISVVIVYLYIPETKQLPVEEIGALFGDEVAVHSTRDGHDIVEHDQAAQPDVKPSQQTDLMHAEKA
ncbi:hypothetical protein LTS07_010487 [Exophiala sideris]|uniref:Major facilitator superfamily (MFS) profile domain-containing protein n=1 Tax=Exophiala sideris TaxID=1016849 RepID=A0ABR0IWR4_9EURO|nr:hypothetical protein LTS07_010487 [Exophiala sideris]KAK5025968.1 hypothetical protein LTR13_010125 [Exophiala sideris]KAK5050655.1 hypothetical protein LTR69_010511 [Exophiala sideris]KAK5177140.1 hypothetical protein LTR44_010268 [Eurotiomycetes sp. CCFEE 6388]